MTLASLGCRLGTPVEAGSLENTQGARTARRDTVLLTCSLNKSMINGVPVVAARTLRGQFTAPQRAAEADANPVAAARRGPRFRLMRTETGFMRRSLTMS
jgi:hypothetical protein